MKELIKVNYDGEQPTVSGRELHEFLEVGTAYKDWFPRMAEYGFEEGKDFNPLKNEQVRIEGTREVCRTIDDHEITVDMAKELCMIQRNEKGKQARRYFLQLEEAWNSPDAVMDRALKFSAKRVKALLGEISTLQVDKAIMQPKADYFDELVERNLLTNFRETAKQLNIKQNEFVGFLIEKKYIYRDKRGKLMPYAEKNNGLFELKECFNDKTEWSGTQTMITPKGRETFRLLF